MDRRTIDTVIGVLRKNTIRTLDITGGAPELASHFKRLVIEAKRLSLRVIVRTNLTIFYEEGMEYLPDFYKDNTVEIAASLPYYMASSVDRVRGDGVFSRSIRALGTLNNLGYGSDPTLQLHLVYNPHGAFLAPSQDKLEEDFKRELAGKFGIVFNRLYAFANMPLGRMALEFPDRTLIGARIAGDA